MRGEKKTFWHMRHCRRSGVWGKGLVVFPKLREDEMPQEHVEYGVYSPMTRGKGPPAALLHPHLPSSEFL